MVFVIIVIAGLFFDSVSVGNQVELSYKLSKYSLQIHWDVAIKNLISNAGEKV